MPPESIERYNVNKGESNVGRQGYVDYEKRYIDIERGDAVPYSVPQNQLNNQLQNQSSGQAVGATRNNSNVIDPLEIVRGMISAGFMPSRAQIVNALNHTDGPIDSSNTWFATFLHKLLRHIGRINNKRI